MVLGAARSHRGGPAGGALSDSAATVDARAGADARRALRHSKGPKKQRKCVAKTHYNDGELNDGELNDGELNDG